MNIRQQIALALKCQIPVPDFRVVGAIPAEQELELISVPGWEYREDVIFNSPDNSVTQVYYFNGIELQHPLIAIIDPYLFAGKQGGKLPCNLVTMFPGELKTGAAAHNLAAELQNIGHKGHVSITYSIMSDALYYNSIELGVHPDLVQNILNLYNLSEDWFDADLRNNSLPEPGGISVSLRLYTNPYSADTNMLVLDNIPIPGAYPLADCYAISYWQDKFHIKNAWQELYKQVSDPVYAHNGICFNTDGGYKARKVYDYLKRKHILKA